MPLPEEIGQERHQHHAAANAQQPGKKTRAQAEQGQFGDQKGSSSMRRETEGGMRR